MSGFEGRWHARVASIFVAAAASAWTASAGAFEVVKNTSGDPIHWTQTDVDFTVDSKLTDRMPDALQAVTAAAAAWSGVSGAPNLHVASSTSDGRIALDGVNTVTLAPEDFAPIGNALAVTVISSAAGSTDIVDTDIVVSRDYSFAMLPATAEPPRGALTISNEASPGARGHDRDGVTFDLQHLLAHEVGHSLGMGDTTGDTGALMYAYSVAGSPSPRQPTSDDTAGIASLYPAGTLQSGMGCGQSNVAGTRPQGFECASALLLVALVASLRGARRRVQLFLPAGMALAMTLAAPARAGSTSSSDSTAHVASRIVSRTSRVSASGVFETLLDVAPVACRMRSCPQQARVHVWGGTVGGITQRVGGYAVPAEGETINVAFTGTMLDATVAEATVAR
jgi:hypothetical protein